MKKSNVRIEAELTEEQIAKNQAIAAKTRKIIQSLNLPLRNFASTTRGRSGSVRRK